MSADDAVMSAEPKVVVGVDGSPSSADALRWAAREATAHRAPLLAVMAWDLLNQPAVNGESRFDPHFNEAKARNLLQQLVHDALGAGPIDDIELHVPCALPARALLDAASARDLTVVGSRGLGGFKGLLLGSVSEQVAHHGPGPVVVVPSPPPCGPCPMRRGSPSHR